MSERRNWIPILVVGALLLGIIGFALWPSRIAVEVAGVRRQPLEVTVEEQGRTRARESYVVAAPIMGRLLRTSVDEGDSVVEGDVLGTMLPPPVDPREVAALRAELQVAIAREREARANLNEAESAAERAGREADRRNQLFDEGAVSIEVRERFMQAAFASKARLETSRAALRASRAEVERVEARLMSVNAAAGNGEANVEVVTAPVTGTVLSVYEESERVVQAGAPLFEIRNTDGLEIVVDLLTEQAVQVDPGASVHVFGWGGGRELEGRVRYVEPKGFEEISALGVEEQRVNVVIDLIDPPTSLGAEYRVEVAIVTWSSEDVLTIPTSAIFRRGRTWRTFTVENGRARLRTIEIGHRGRDRAEVLGGLDGSAEVIVFPSDLIEDDIRVSTTMTEEG